MWAEIAQARRELRTFTVPEEWRQEAAASPDLGRQPAPVDPWLADQPLCQCVACTARWWADQ